MLYKFKPDDRKLLLALGDKPIAHITICRKPISNNIKSLLNILSLGQFEKNLNDSEYDKLFHLFLQIKLSTGQNIVLEKNERVNLQSINKIDNETETLDVTFNNKLTLNTLINNTINNIGNENFYIYKSHSWNCQNFVMNILNSNGLLNENNKHFILQDTEQLFKKLGYLKYISDKLTDVAAIGNVVYHGGKIKRKNIKSIKFHRSNNINDIHNWFKQNKIKMPKLITYDTNYYIFNF
jgi:hypothetical protein